MAFCMTLSSNIQFWRNWDMSLKLLVDLLFTRSQTKIWAYHMNSYTFYNVNLKDITDSQDFSSAIPHFSPQESNEKDGEKCFLFYIIVVCAMMQRTKYIWKRNLNRNYHNWNLWILNKDMNHSNSHGWFNNCYKNVKRSVNCCLILSTYTFTFIVPLNEWKARHSTKQIYEYPTDSF